MIEAEPEQEGPKEQGPEQKGPEWGQGALLASLRAARTSRVSVEIAAARGEASARCALSFLPDALFVIHGCAEWNVYDPPVAASLRRLAYLPGLDSYSCDVDRDGDLAKVLEVTSVPTLIAFHQGREVGRLIGGGDVEAWVLVQRAEVLGGTGSAPSQSAG